MEPLSSLKTKRGAGTPALAFFNFSSDLADEPAVQQVCHLFQQLWNRVFAGILPRLGHNFVNRLDLGPPVSPLDAEGCLDAKGKAHPHGHLNETWTQGTPIGR